MTARGFSRRRCEPIVPAPATPEIPSELPLPDGSAAPERLPLTFPSSTGSGAALCFTIPGDPVAWARAGAKKGGGYFDTQKGAKLVAAWEAKQAMRECGWTSPQNGALALDLLCVFEPPASWSAKRKAAALGQPKFTAPDLSNLIKHIEDALNGVAYRDDAMISRITARKLYGRKAATVVTLKRDAAPRGSGPD